MLINANLNAVTRLGSKAMSIEVLGLFQAGNYCLIASLPLHYLIFFANAWLTDKQRKILALASLLSSIFSRDLIKRTSPTDEQTKQLDVIITARA